MTGNPNPHGIQYRTIGPYTVLQVPRNLFDGSPEHFYFYIPASVNFDPARSQEEYWVRRDIASNTYTCSLHSRASATHPCEHILGVMNVLAPSPT